MVIYKVMSRFRRCMKLRDKLKKLGSVRLVVHRTSRHIYAQIVAENNAKILVSASTLEKEIKRKITGYTGNKNAASIVGEVIAKRALNFGVKKISFDRSGFKYHGRIQMLAMSARKFGLDF
ncbi:50S ribosomal protein L18 [Candidatus Westeberhardia cardiocondylae]|uniref:Large ribosomal subunit protein uL18 n=1 Tax=Candidatus Westeberhardia cardiocondylae TaxID=1594731 RepID=A0A0H5BWI1_9ENTR|nr:50S ribosomal protein L18 [Candidatus Westeberhardia cardiocondylae]MCR3756178.1 50S ribosomal subunit protein L18 [Candidatus Westeberhardia cardiocondylae]CEN32055.1 50S ribosomal protein L18 [Candidatus Westeberhardia cardiocondylae]